MHRELWAGDTVKDWSNTSFRVVDIFILFCYIFVLPEPCPYQLKLM